MTNADFNIRCEALFEACMSVMNSKGIEYSGMDDKFANFKRLAVMQGLPTESIWLTYFTKHFDSIVSYIKKRNQGLSIQEVESKLSEPIQGRIIDMINYLFILNGMTEEQRTKESVSK